MDGAEDNKLEKDTLDKDILQENISNEFIEQEKILEQTYKAIEYYDNCNILANDDIIRNADYREDLESDDGKTKIFDYKEEHELMLIGTSKLNILKAKVKNAVYSIKSFIMGLISKNNNKNEESYEIEKRKVTTKEESNINLVKTNEVPVKEINNKILSYNNYNRYEIQNSKHITGASGSIFYNNQEQGENAVSKEQQESTNIKEKTKYIDIPDRSGATRNEEMER